MNYTQENVKELGTILGIWAHPDDETWSSAGLMKMACLNGQKVGIMTATKGDAGQTADEKIWPKKSLKNIREKELEKSLSYIGNVQQYWLDYEDGKLAESDTDTAVDKIVRILKVFRPNSVVTFESNGITGHDDHKTISNWTSLAVEKSGLEITILHSIESVEKFEQSGDKLDRKFNIFFNTNKPKLIKEKDADIVLKLPNQILESKLQSLKAHASQTSKLFNHADSRKALEILAGTECFVVESV